MLDYILLTNLKLAIDRAMNKGRNNMLNTDIFKFEFVDRTEERQIIDNYLFDFSNNSDYALWIHGKRGTGKSFFLTEYVMVKREFTSIYVNVKNEDESSGTYIKQFISKINKVANLKFTSYIRTNYKSIATIGQKALNLVLNLVDVDDIGLAELGASLSNFFVSKYGEKENAISVIKKYIEEALKKCGNIVFLLDNFSQCDTTSLEILVSVIHELAYNAKVKFILCTTDEDLENRFDIKNILAEKISNKPMLIEPFQQKQLFARMLERTFDLNEENIKLLSRTFELCNGFPQRFKEILINLYTIQGIIVDDNQARFVSEAFSQQLIKGELTFDIDSLCAKYKSAKIILQITNLWGEPLPINILYDFLNFYTNIDPISFLKEEIGKTLIVLEELHIIVRSFEEQMILLQFEHDSLKLAVEKYFDGDRSVPFLHFSIYEYLRQQNKLDSPYWCRYYQSLLAYHSYKSQADEWIDYNYYYGCNYFNSGILKKAGEIFSRLEMAVSSLNGEQLLTMGITFFYCGQYYKADDILTNIQSRELTRNFSLEQHVKLYIFQARTRSCILDSRRALEAINCAENLNVKENKFRIMILGAKQSILFLAPGGFQEAKSIFDALVKENLEIPEMALVYQSAMDYYEGHKSQKYLNKGLALARKFSDYITEGKILNNMGFEFLRCGDYTKAKTLFEESISLLKESQPHEQVYPYSNLAVLYMIFGDWEQALNSIVEALFWNKSTYASLVLKTNRMLCYYFLGNQQWEKIYRVLFEYINSAQNIDDKIYKKICINIALIALKNGQINEGNAILDCCRPHLEMEWPHGKYRFLNIYHKLTGLKVELSLPQDPRYIEYYCKIEFEPWLLNFSHD